MRKRIWENGFGGWLSFCGCNDVMRLGVTIVELMVCILLAVILAASVGPSAVKLLRVVESSREEGFMREKLATLAGIYADWLSLAQTYVVTNMATGVKVISADYPREMEGISFETNNLTKVTACHSAVSNGMLNIWFDTRDLRFPDHVRKVAFDGDALLEHVSARIVEASLNPVICPPDGYCTLSIMATNHFWDAKADAYSVRTVRTERIVRLWNAIR